MCNENNKSVEVKEMREFVKDFFTNRFGNVLAIINFVVITFNRNGISERLGLENLELFTFIVNLPARVASLIMLEIFVSPKRFALRFDVNYYSLETLLFVYLQWLFIGWMAKAIARRIQPNQV